MDPLRSIAENNFRPTNQGSVFIDAKAESFPCAWVVSDMEFCNCRLYISRWIHELRCHVARRLCRRSWWWAPLIIFGGTWLNGPVQDWYYTNSSEDKPHPFSVAPHVMQTANT